MHDWDFTAHPAQNSLYMLPSEGMLQLKYCTVINQKVGNVMC